MLPLRSINLIHVIVYRFYPGLSMPRSPAIEGGPQPTGVIEGPEDEVERPTGSETNLPFRRLNGGLRPARVVGQFDHPVLPEPPVSELSACCWIMIGSFCTAQNDDTRNGFLVVLCHCRQRGQRQWWEDSHESNKRSRRCDPRGAEVHY